MSFSGMRFGDATFLIVVGKSFSSVATRNLFMYARLYLSALRVGLGSQFNINPYIDFI